MSSEPLHIERRDDGIAVLTLALPDRRNAMTEALTGAWGAAVAGLRADADLRVVVVTGEGSAFCAGGDLSWIEGGEARLSPDQLRAKMLPFYRTWLSVRELEVPVLGAINGPAIGAGLCLALACDLRYAAPSARFGAPFTTLGMHAGMAASYLLPEAIGLPRAREMLYTGRIVGAEEAAAIGLINAVLPADTLLESTLEVATRIAATAPVAVRLTKVALARGPQSFDAALQWEALAQPITMATDDLREGLRAVADKRPPRFTGR